MWGQLIQRSAMSVRLAVFAVTKGLPADEVVALSDEIRDELWTALCLAPLLSAMGSTVDGWRSASSWTARSTAQASALRRRRRPS
eukprot:6939861-Alexandrium_andersonii.AAC.1